MTPCPHPGTLLRERFLEPLGVTPYRLAKAIGVHVRRVSELLKGHRALTPDTAARLALYFDVPARWWLEMQARYDAEHVAPLEELRALVTPYPHLDEVLVTPDGVIILEAPDDKGPNPNPGAYSQEFLDRIRAQAALEPPAPPRVITEFSYPDGTRALVGTP